MKILGKYYQEMLQKFNPGLQNKLHSHSILPPQKKKPTLKSQRILPEYFAPFFKSSVCIQKEIMRMYKVSPPCLIFFSLFINFSLVLVCGTLPVAISVTEINAWYSFLPLVALITKKKKKKRHLFILHVVHKLFKREIQGTQSTFSNAFPAPETTNICTQIKCQISFQLVDCRAQEFSTHFEIPKNRIWCQIFLQWT